MMRTRSLLSLALILSAALAVSAHDTWLLARRVFVAPGASVWLDLTSGMAFPILDYAIKPERVSMARFRLNGHTREIAARTSARKSLALHVPLSAAGVATFWVELKPKSLELTPEQVAEYFDEINASGELRHSWANAGGTKRWREIYTKHAKTFVRVGRADADRSWSQPVGLALEIVPETDPTALKAGDNFTVRVLKNGAPLPDFSLGIVREGNILGEFQKTDAAGRVSFRLARSGKWLMRATELRPANKPDTEWESDFTTLTIQVQ
jgi:uncharacterized GH25 family protein